MPERIFGLVVGLGNHDRQIRFAQDGGAKQLVAMGNAGAGDWRNVVFNDVEQAGDEIGGIHGHGRSPAWGWRTRCGTSKWYSSRLLPSPPRSTTRKSLATSSGVSTPCQVFMAMLTPWPGRLMKARGRSGVPDRSRATMTRNGRSPSG